MHDLIGLFRFLEDVKNYKLINGNIVNKIDNFSNIIDTYKVKLESFYNNYGVKDICGNFKNYIREIEISNYYKYTLCWNIDNLVKDLEIIEYPVVNIELSKIIESVDLDNISMHQVNNVASINNQPIIVVRLPQVFPNDIIIDGNHRVIWNYRNNKNHIKAFYLPYNFHVKYLTSEFFKLLYMIESNISIMSAFMSGYEKDYKKYLFEI